MKKLNYESVKELRDKGLSIIAIARVFAVSRQRIYQVLDKQYNKRRSALYTARKISLDTQKQRE